MIVAFSTSSPQASVAIFSDDGSLVWSGEDIVPRAASGACMRMLAAGLKSTGEKLDRVTLFLADLGPGSFTGVRVGVTLAKTLTFTVGARAGGTDAFDLIAMDETVVLPSKRGEWFVRRPGKEPVRSGELPAGSFVGYGAGIGSCVYPQASRFAGLLTSIESIEPELLVPAYLIEPSISQPKKPFGASVAQ